MLRLLVTHPGQSPRLLTFTKPEVFVGRESACDLVLSDPGAALYHARIALQNDQAVLSNLANTGTRVNNQTVTSPTPLLPGDTITIAGTTLQLAPDDTPWLELSVTSPDGTQRTFVFHKDPIILGRVDKNDIPLPKGNISKQHTKIWRQNGFPCINDLKSTNGTFVNGQKVSQDRPLYTNDRIQIGDFVVLVVRATPSPGAQPPARAPEPSAPVARMPVTPSNPPFPQRPPEPTRRDPRLSVTDHALLHSLGAGVILGTSFAFYRAQLFQQPAFAWLLPLLGTKTLQPQVVSLLGTSPVDLPGARLQPTPPPALRLAVVTSDRALYREGSDEVRLLVVDPFSPGASLTLVLTLAGTEFAKYPVTLNAQGARAFSLRDLPAGDFSLRIQGAPSDEPACSFTVATYKLVPLVASLLSRQLHEARLSLRLRLESFGVPVEGEVRLEILDQGKRLGEARALAREGVLEASLPLTGEGPHTVNVQLVQDPGRTATIPIVGSRAQERRHTVFSSLGAEVSGSLLPGEGARLVRGLFLREGAQKLSPLVLERVDTRRARLTAKTALEAVRVVLLDPAFPRRRSDAQSADAAPHPFHGDRLYQVAQKFFEDAKYSESKAIFAEARAQQGNPHPYYAYYLACCCAQLGELAPAVSWLRTAIVDGWTDFSHLASDDDLRALRGLPSYQSLSRGGRRDVSAPALAVGESLEIDIPDPMAFLAVGAFAEGEPWEGWAALVTPDDFAPEIYLPGGITPSQALTVEVDTGLAGPASVYLVVKDARLLAQDTPQSRLGGQLKSAVEALGKQLSTGSPRVTLNQAAPPPLPPAPGAVPRTVVPSSAPTRPSSAVSRARTEMAPAPAPMAAAPYRAQESAGRVLSAPVPAAPVPSASWVERDEDLAEEAELGVVENRNQAPPATSGARAETSTSPERPAIVEEPEVLYAGLLETEAGRVVATVQLGDAFADYLVEAFVLSGHSWAVKEARFRAERNPFASLELPAFLHAEDTALGRLSVGASSGQLRVTVTRDGDPVSLLHEGRPVIPGEVFALRRAEFVFLAKPGDYEAAVEDVGSGAVDRTGKRVEVPGQLTRVARRLRFLRPSESLSRAEDASIVGLRVLPGLDRPFSLLCEATSNYSHDCCEQTAAKMLAASAAFAFADQDPARRARAEASLVAGASRERLMWLPKRGFKMYPESGNSPHDYYGPKAARYLMNLDLLRSLPKSQTLQAAIETCLQMAQDALSAYRIPWPPTQAQSCEEAYSVLRFGTDAAAKERALSLVRQRVGAALPGHPQARGAVYERTEKAFAAACLLRAGPASLAQALSLANEVVRDLGPEGRLYSTVDSVAAIALFSELHEAKVIGENGRAQVNGKTFSSSDAAQFEGEIESISSISGTLAVEVLQLVEERWDQFSASVPLWVALEKEGRPVRKLSAGDSLNLRVRLEQGYQNGDLLWVCLPDALSRVVGGGQVKRFSLDFAGQNEISIPLAATGATFDADGNEGVQRFALCVRNMFEEERAGNPGWLEVRVTAPGTSPETPSGGGSSFFGRVASGLKGLFKKG